MKKLILVLCLIFNFNSQAMSPNEMYVIIGAEYILNLLPKGTHDWNKFIEPAELNDWAESSNLAIKDIIGMTYNPITKIYKLEQDTAVNYICHYQK